MKQTKFDDVYMKVFPELMGCLLGLPLMFVIGLILLFQLMVWGIPHWMAFIGGLLALINPQIFLRI